MEHEQGYEASFGQMILAARTRITYRLQDLSGQVCLLQRYSDVSPDLIERYDIQAVFLSGNGTDWDLYDQADQSGLRQVILSGIVPIFGFCGGFQFIAETLGVPIERIGKIPAGEEDPSPFYAQGWQTEFGYLPVSLDTDHPLTAGIATNPMMRQAHSYEIKSLPEGFDCLGSTKTTPIQVIASNNDRPLIVGTQFHPEYWTLDDPAGEQLIRNFCRIANLLT